MTLPSDTIAAIATAPGQAGIAVVRLSGPESMPIADRLFSGARRPSECRGGEFLHGFVRSPDDPNGQALDEVILLVYHAPKSYTREDVVEIQSHGGRVCAARILRAALRAGARMAEPGEFTRRAFLNGRLDLVQAEAVADLIQAQSDRAAQAAMEQLGGRLSSSLAGLYDDVLACSGELEVTLDFADEELPSTVVPNISERLQRVLDQMNVLLATWHEGHLLREGARVVISGLPNAGKSTLFNRLVGHERTIVTDIPGTTRDTIEESVVFDGIPVRLVDTAGLRETSCPVESQGVQRARSVLEQADLIIYLVDSSQAVAPEPVMSDIEHIGERGLVLLTKCDLESRIDLRDLDGTTMVPCTLIDDRDIGTIRKAIMDRLDVATDAMPHAVVSERHRARLEAAAADLETAISLVISAGPDAAVLIATHLRDALESLGSITGRVYSDDLLDSVFKRFCIGK